MKSADYTNLVDVARRNARLRPDKIAVVFEDRETSYAAFDARTDRLASALVRLGVRHQDRIAVFAKNSDRYLECTFGAAKSGSVLTPINWRLTPREVEQILGDSGARIIFIDKEFLPVVDRLPMRDQLTVILFDGGDGSLPGYEDILAQADAAAPDIAVSEDDVVVQVYTSGTTGLPKGAMLAHRNFIRLCDLEGPPTPPHFRNAEDEVVLLIVPLFHAGGVEVSLRPLFCGATVVIHSVFDTVQVLAEIPRRRITNISMVPTILQMIVEHPLAQSTDFSSLRVIYYGAAPIPPQLVRLCMPVLKCGFSQSYGMTESGGTFCSLPPEDHDPEGTPRMLSAGKPLPGVELKIVAPDGSMLAPGEPGEIMMRARSVMKGYWGMPEATANTIDPDGWLHTGDVGFLDADGYVYIHDRLKDVIQSGAENIYPAEIEKTLFDHPQIAEVAIIGVPDPKWGEAVKAVVVPKPGETIDPQAFTRWAREQMAGYKVPRSLEIVESLPRNATGKVLKGELRKAYGA